MDYFLDTHILAWWFGAARKLPNEAKVIIGDDQSRFLVSCITVLELQYLFEIGRISGNMTDVMEALRGDNRFRILPFDVDALEQSVRLTTTRDPFDRMILGQALALATKIITKDKWMKKAAPHLVIP